MVEAETTEKKRRGRKKAVQTKFCDTFEELPEQVQAAVSEYSEALSQRMAWQESEAVARRELKDQMEAHGLKFVPDPNDEEKVFALQTSDPEQKIKKLPRSKVIAGLE